MARVEMGCRNLVITVVAQQGWERGRGCGWNHCPATLAIFKDGVLGRNPRVEHRAGCAELAAPRVKSMDCDPESIFRAVHEKAMRLVIVGNPAVADEKCRRRR